MFSPVEIAVFAISGGLTVASQLRPGRLFLRRFGKKIFFSSVSLIFLINILLAYWEKIAWQKDPLLKFLLPPYHSYGYFIFSASFKFFFPYLISLLIALALLYAGRFFNRKYQEKFFEKEELWLAATSIFLVGYPGWIIYFIILILAYFILHTSYFIQRREAVRLPLYRLWATIALLTVLLIKLPWLTSLSLWQRSAL